MVGGGETRADSSITFAPSSRSFYDGRYVHARTRKIVMARGEGILRSIHVTITLNSVYPLVHRRAGTLAKPARARRAPFHTTIDHFAFADYRDPETIIRRSFHASTRLRSHRCHLTRCARRTHLLEPENSSREDYASLVAFSIIFIYTLSKIIRVVAASIGHFLFLWLRHSLLITRPGLSILFAIRQFARKSVRNFANSRLNVTDFSVSTSHYPSSRQSVKRSILSKSNHR